MAQDCPKWLSMALYGSKCPLWLHVAQDVSRLVQMAQYGYMASYGSVQPFMVQDGTRLPQMAQDAYMASYSSIWLYMALKGPYEYIWLKTAPDGS